MMNLVAGPKRWLVGRVPNGAVASAVALISPVGSKRWGNSGSRERGGKDVRESRKRGI